MIRKFLKRFAHPKYEMPTKARSLHALTSLGVPIEGVIDVGVQEGTPALTNTLKNVPHLLIEPIVEWNPSIKRHYTKHPGGFEIVNVAAAHTVGEATIRMKSVLGSAIPSHANLVEGAPSQDGDRRVPISSIDAIISARPDFPRPFLIKIDVDGAEMAVLTGAKEAFTSTSVVVLEIGVTNLRERIIKMAEHGFDFFDIVDLCYYGDRFIQADAVFVARKYSKQALSFYQNGFEPALWYELSTE